jgi:hypothetical protein
VFHRISGGFGAVVDSQLGENAADVVAHRAFAQEEGLGNFAVGFTFRNEQQDVFFLLAEVRKGRRAG